MKYEVQANAEMPVLQAAFPLGGLPSFTENSARKGIFAEGS